MGGIKILVLKEKMSTKVLTKISILSVIAFIIMILEFPLGFFPEFLKIDFSDVPALIGAFAMGPIAGVIIEFIKNILHIVIRGTATAGIGELANFVVGGTFVFIAGIIYSKNKTFKNALIGMITGTIIMSVIAGIFNYLLFIPLYAVYYGLPLEEYIKIAVEMAQKANSFVVDYKTFILISIVPFNIIKGIIISIITLVFYKRISKLLH